MLKALTRAVGITAGLFFAIRDGIWSWSVYIFKYIWHSVDAGKKEIASENPIVLSLVNPFYIWHYA